MGKLGSKIIIVSFLNPFSAHLHNRMKHNVVHSSPFDHQNLLVIEHHHADAYTVASDIEPIEQVSDEGQHVEGPVVDAL